MQLRSEKGGILVKVVLAVVAIAILLAVCTNSDANATPPNPDHKVVLCHRTGSATNPYVMVDVDIASSGYVKAGHNNHEQVGNGLGGDIIPAYTYTSKAGVVFNYPGKNLTTVIGGSTGADILANGCLVPTSTPTETPPPTTVPPTTPPPTTAPPTTEPPTTTAPPTSVVVPPADCVGNDKPARCFSNVPKAGGDLAFTGMSAGWAIAAAAGLGLAGTGALLWVRKRSIGLDS